MPGWLVGRRGRGASGQVRERDRGGAGQDLEAIDGHCWPGKDNPARIYKAHLDLLPFPALDLFPTTRATGRCASRTPVSMSFCIVPVTNERTWRFWLGKAWPTKWPT
jgi:hypothetical protein